MTTAARGRPTLKHVPRWAKALKMRRIDLELSQERITDVTEGLISQSTMSALEVGKQELTDLSYLRVVSLAEALNWTLAEMQAATGVNLGIKGDDLTQQVQLLGGAIRVDNRVQVPVYSLSNAGMDDLSSAPIITFIDVEPKIAHHRNRATFLLDNATMEPTINEGDCIHVDTSELEIKDNKIYLFLVSETVFVVRAYVGKDGAVTLAPDNRRYPPPHALEGRVIGRVFAYSPQTKLV